jgi:hypothetical protein
MNSSIKKKSILSYRFLDSTFNFARIAYEFEQKQKIDIELYHNNAIAEIFMIVTFLEAHINEFFYEISENESYLHKTINVENHDVISKLWNKGIPRTARYSILDKYEIASNLTKGKVLDHSCYPYQDVDALIKLRNSLIHYEPLWQEVSPCKNVNRLEQLLKGKYKTNPFLNEKTEPFFPFRCLSSDCLIWSIKCSITFVRDFYDNMKIDRTFKNVYQYSLKRTKEVTA